MNVQTVESQKGKILCIATTSCQDQVGLPHLPHCGVNILPCGTRGCLKPFKLTTEHAFKLSDSFLSLRVGGYA
jgi:hypothetical protein